MAYVDTEYLEACEISKNERHGYYIVSMTNGGRCIKSYTPSIAKLHSKRTGMRIQEITGVRTQMKTRYSNCKHKFPVCEKCGTTHAMWECIY